jgi:hypothetical protein
MEDEGLIEIMNLLVVRLEHIPVDSKMARKASGLRGNLLKVLDGIQNGNTAELKKISALTETAFQLLGEAALEISSYT